jgi:hypothetical protein
MFFDLAASSQNRYEPTYFISHMEQEERQKDLEKQIEACDIEGAQGKELITTR